MNFHEISTPDRDSLRKSKFRTGGVERVVETVLIPRFRVIFPDRVTREELEWNRCQTVCFVCRILQPLLFVLSAAPVLLS